MSVEEFSDRDERLGGILAACLEAAESGCTANRDELLSRHPEFCSELREFFASYDRVPGLAPHLNATSSSAADGGFEWDRSWWQGKGQRLGDYELLQEIGRGGMAVVYEATQLSLRRRVALKVLPFAAMFDERHLQRFKNEAHAAALLHHTHIVPVYAVGCERGVHFYAMQFIQGQSLATLIRQLREGAEAKSGREHAAVGSRQSASGDKAATPGQALARGGAKSSIGAPVHDEGLQSTIDLSVVLTGGASHSSEAYYRRIARLVIQAAEALDHAHQNGVVHRDVKPANLLVNAASTLWVTDFGLAQLQTDTGLTRPGDLLGTLRYMSPEQASGQQTVVDHRTDIYSLGATLYELLTLEPVFGGDTRQELVYQILHQEPRPLRLVNRAVPAELETIVLKSLAKSPNERYGTATEFAQDLQRYLDHQPIRARRPSLADRARKWSRRHPSVLVTSMLSLFVVTLASLISNRMISWEQEKTVAALNQVSQEQLRTAAALERERVRANEAETQFRQARRAADVLVQLSETEVDRKIFPVHLRLRILTIALENYQSFIESVDAADRPELAANREDIQNAIRDVTTLHEDVCVIWVQVWIHLLWSPLVLDEMGLTGGERERAAVSRQRWQNDWQAVIDQTRNADDPARRARYVEMAKRHNEEFTEAFTEEQRERLRQIALQAFIVSIAGSATLQHLGFPMDVRAATTVMGSAEVSIARGPASSSGRATEIGDVLDVSLDEGVVLLFAALAKGWREVSGKPFGALYGAGSSQTSENSRQPDIPRSAED